MERRLLPGDYTQPTHARHKPRSWLCVLNWIRTSGAQASSKGIGMAIFANINIDIFSTRISIYRYDIDISHQLKTACFQFFMKYTVTHLLPMYLTIMHLLPEDIEKIM